MALHSVLAPASDAKFVGDEPVWHDVTVSDAEYNKEMMRGFNWHNYCACDRDLMKYVEAYIREYRVKTHKQDIQNFRDHGKINNTYCFMARMFMQGFPLNATHKALLHNYIQEVTAGKKVTRAAKQVEQTGNRPTILDRIRQQVSGTLSDLDVRVDDAFDGNIAPADDIKADILSHGYKAPQLKIIKDYLDKNVSEWASAYAGEDEQLVEGYSYMGRRDFKKIIETFREVLEALSEQSTRIKAQRIRKRKPVDKKKMVSKIRYMKEFDGMQSKNPVDIIGANMVWVYDTKKRRLGYYEAEVKDSLYVKANKIEGFKNTCEKILRKPEEQLTSFMSLRKNQTVNWLDAVKAKCGALSGRMNDHILILRID
jgi:hypothetical protein